MSKANTTYTHPVEGEWTFRQSVDPDIINIADKNGDVILTITSDCKVIWSQPDKTDEAADMFTAAIVMSAERMAGIKQSRQEWEDRILKALVSEAKNAPLTPEALTDVLGKCIMLDKLKGLK